jgi:hypothetical protein
MIKKTAINDIDNGQIKTFASILEADTRVILDQYAIVLTDPAETPRIRIYLSNGVLSYQYWLETTWSNPSDLATPNGRNYLQLYTTAPPVSGTRVGGFTA